MKRTFTMTLDEIVAENPTPRRELWIAPNEGGQDSGTGTPSSPLRVSSPQDFDAIFRSRHTADGHSPTIYRLMPGEYRTQGCWAHPAFATLWQCDAIIGSENVVLKLADPVTETNGTERHDVHVLGAGSPFESGNFCHVEGIQIFGGGSELRDRRVFTTSGLRFYGSGCRAIRVDVGGLSGSIDPVPTASGVIPLEAFGISFASGERGRVRDCQVAGGPGGVSYLSAFSSAPASIDGVVFEDCAAHGTFEHAAFTVYRNTTLRNCRGTGFGYGIYNDTGDVENVNVDGGLFFCDRVGLGLVATVTGGAKRSVIVDKARFRFPRRISKPVGIELILRSDSPNPDFWNIHATRCEFSSDDRFTLVSTDAPARLLRLVRVSDSIIPLDTRLNVPDGHTMRFTGLISPEGTPYLDTKPTGLVTTFGK